MPANGVGGICSLLVSPREVRELGEIYSTGGTGVRGKVRKNRMYSWAKDGRRKKRLILYCIFIIARKLGSQASVPQNIVFTLCRMEHTHDDLKKVALNFLPPDFQSALFSGSG